jgi:hypothetical protein
MKSLWIGLGLVVCLLPIDVARAAAPPPPAAQAAQELIDWLPSHFTGRLARWRSETPTTLLIANTQGAAYRATFFRPCPQLAHTRRFEFKNLDRSETGVDRFSAISVKGATCYFRDLEPVPPNLLGETAIAGGQ